jgi:hypothetical protein
MLAIFDYLLSAYVSGALALAFLALAACYMLATRAYHSARARRFRRSRMRARMLATIASATRDAPALRYPAYAAFCPIPLRGTIYSMPRMPAMRD